MQDLSWSGFKRHPGLQPLFVTMSIGITFVLAYCGRLISKPPDVTWRHDPEPFNSYKEKHYKWVNIQGSKAIFHGPDYRKEDAKPYAGYDEYLAKAK